MGRGMDLYYLMNRGRCDVLQRTTDKFARQLYPILTAR
jgi:hypothetical protein